MFLVWPVCGRNVTAGLVVRNESEVEVLALLYQPALASDKNLVTGSLSVGGGSTVTVQSEPETISAGRNGAALAQEQRCAIRVRSDESIRRAASASRAIKALRRPLRAAARCFAVRSGSGNEGASVMSSLVVEL